MLNTIVQDVEKNVQDINNIITARRNELESQIQQLEQEFLPKIGALKNELSALNHTLSGISQKLKFLNPPGIEFLENSVNVLELIVRTTRCLHGEGINTIKDLVGKSEADLLMIPNLGRRSLKEVEQVLASHGLSLRNDK